jgi:L-ascorbate metabolism protein UlaG (beta-lactamase superfamily)
MKVSYVSHACLLIDTGKTLIATDPWFDGPAFCGQWNVFPRPLDDHAGAVGTASVLLISHPHEDHLHEPTLKRLCGAGSKRLFYPFFWYPETIAWLRSMDLGDVVEARSARTYPIDDGATVTFLGAPGQNSIIVIECGGQVLVNVNDALHSESRSLIDVYVTQIRRRWPRIDVVFCGFGGASYYPNALHSNLKDDRLVARLREQLFIHNFCRIAHGLAPRVAIPFAADFVLLAPHQRWINESRFPREAIPDYYRKHFDDSGKTTIHAMYPGDNLVDGGLDPASPYRKQLRNGRLDHLIDLQYPEEVSAFRTTGTDGSRSTLDQWAQRLAIHLNAQTKFHSGQSLEGLGFELKLKDLSPNHWFNIRWTGSRFEVRTVEEVSLGSVARIETTTAVLEASTQNDWGGDVLTIGYACDINVLNTQNPGKARLCVALLTRYPRPKSYALRYPIRTLDYLQQSAPMVLARMKSKIRARLRGVPDEELITSSHWLTGNVEAIRKACRLPELHSDGGADGDRALKIGH